jgi:hypothetical protein
MNNANTNNSNDSTSLNIDTIRKKILKRKSLLRNCLIIYRIYRISVELTSLITINKPHYNAIKERKKMLIFLLPLLCDIFFFIATKVTQFYERIIFSSKTNTIRKFSNNGQAGSRISAMEMCKWREER